MQDQRIGVVTFDLWDTVFLDDTDEPKRAAAGVPPKRVARRNLVHEYLERHSPIAREAVDLACDVSDAAFRMVWFEHYVTWSVRERLEVVMNGLGRDLPEDEMAGLVRAHEEMELEFRPDTVPGICQAIETLSEKYRLAVVSDAVFSPGRCLRELLDGEGLLGYFEGFAFSDEVGRSKPAPAMFESISQQLGVAMHEIVHVGDREEKDIVGPHRVGARAVLLTAGKDRGSENSQADAICYDCRDLPAVIELLNRP
jgi:putative hydrolase of the HAD superfamily